MRLNQIARKLNMGTGTIVAFLEKKGFTVEGNPNTKITSEQVKLIHEAFGGKFVLPKKETPIKQSVKKPTITAEVENNPNEKTKEVPQPLFPPPPPPKITLLRKVSMNKRAVSSKEEKEKKPVAVDTPPQKEKKSVKEEGKHIATPVPALKGVTAVRKINIPKRPAGEEHPAEPEREKKKTPRKRIHFQLPHSLYPPKRTSPFNSKEKKKGFSSTKKESLLNRRKSRKNKREHHTISREKQRDHSIRLTAFITANELAQLFDLPIQELIVLAVKLGIDISINQRLDEETISVLADECKKKITFISVDEALWTEEAPDAEEDLIERAPIVTIMGHVDHGKTSLLDYIRKTKVTAGEAGGITQHIGAYEVNMPDSKRVIFLDTPGHEAFTAMRARGVQVTDIAIIIIAADDGIMPQTKEAIGHAQLASLPIVFAFNKIDRPEANVERVKQQLADMNIMVEDWGGDFQSQEISAHTGEGIDALLEKVLLEAELLELKSNPNKSAKGSIIEATLQKGRGYVATAMIQDGTLKKGDIVLAGPHYGKIKAIFSTQAKSLKQAGPSTPVQLLGLSGAPQAGQSFKVVLNEKDARTISAKYESILQEQRLRAQKGNPLSKFKRILSGEEAKEELRILIKGDVDGSIEALADALVGLSNEQTNVCVIYKGVGPITESDVLLAAASDALIIGFQTLLEPFAKKAIEREKVTLKQCNIIYEVTDYIKGIMEGADEQKEEVVIGQAEVIKTFFISRIGTIAGCIVRQGVIKRNASIRILREEKVLFSGAIKQLKREKEVIKEAKAGSECGISAQGFQDIQEGDIIEAFEMQVVA